MNITVHNMDISFITGKKGGIPHLKKHISYVSRNTALHFTYNVTAQNLNKLLAFAREKLQKRKDARIALKMYIALPYKWYTRSQEKTDYLELKAQELTKLIADTLQLKEEDIMLFFHKPDKNSKNFHVHVVTTPQTKDGNPLAISPATLKTFHQKLDEFFARQGFEIFRYKNFPELGLNPKALRLPTWAYKKKPEAVAVVTEKRREARMRAEETLNKRNKQVYEFCNLLYDKEETVWIMMKNSETKKVRHKITKVAKINDKLLAYLRYRNAQGFDIYITLNTFKSDSQNRIEQEIEPLQDKIWLDIDSEKLKRDGLEVLKQIMKELNLPPPTALVRTSETQHGGNYQAIWKFNQKVDFNRLKKVMQELEKRYGLDATHDGARVFRLPGFNNKKKEGKAGRDLCSLVGTGKIYDINLLEKLELGLTAHGERTQSVLRKNEEPQLNPQPQPKQELQPKEIQPKQEAKPTSQTKQKQKPETKPQQETKSGTKTQPQPKPQPKLQDPWQILMAYRDILAQELKKLTKEKVDLHLPSLPEVFTLREGLQILDRSFAKELLLLTDVHTAEKILHQTLTKHRPQLIQNYPNYPKELMLYTYQQHLEKVAETHGINIFLSINKNYSEISYSEIEWAFAKELAKDALRRFQSPHVAYAQALKFFRTTVELYRPNKAQKNPKYAEITMRKAFDEAFKEFKQRELEETQQEQEGKQQEQQDIQTQEQQRTVYRAPPRRR